MSDAAISTARPSDLRTILETNTAWDVIIGPAEPGQATPFVACWPITPVRTGEAIAQEDAGQIHDVWQINCFGATVGQALAVRDAVIGLVWPAGWELVDVGPIVQDTSSAPVGWFVPVDYKHTTVA